MDNPASRREAQGVSAPKSTRARLAEDPRCGRLRCGIRDFQVKK
jgi:hypothetical protein